MRAFVGAAVAVVLAGVMAGCSGAGTEAEAEAEAEANVADGDYATLPELHEAVVSAGLDCDKAEDVTDQGDGRFSMGCSDSYTLYMFTAPEVMQAHVDFADAHRQGILASHWVVGNDWYVITSGEQDAADLAPKIGGEVVQVGS